MLCGCSGLWHRHEAPVIADNHHGHNHNHLHADDLAELNGQSGAAKILSDNDQNKKVINFDQDFADDIFCSDQEMKIVRSLVKKFRAIQNYVGHGNFNLLGMDEFFLHTNHAPGVNGITSEEKSYLEMLFYFDASKYGFYGEKSFHSFTESVDKSKVVKVPYSGHFLRKGKSLETYEKIKKDIGQTVILTSGVRSMAKQFHLFLEKTLASNGNLSRASRSLAPPGYSFHGKGDFDIGRIDYGYKNFTDDFANTDEFKNLQRLGYIEIRYTEKNQLGVRFEPWHIKINT